MVENTKITLPVLTRSFSVDSVATETRTVRLAWTAGAEALINQPWREPFYEQLAVANENVRLDRLQTAPLLNTHNRSGLDAILGSVSRAWIENGVGYADVVFSERAEKYYKDVVAGIIKNVSVGYKVFKYQEVDKKNGMQVLRAIDWEPFEISLVAVPVDANAMIVRSLSEGDFNECLILNKKEEKMSVEKIEVPQVQVPQVPVEQARADAGNIIDVEKIKTETERAVLEKLNKRSAEIDEVFGSFPEYSGLKIRCLQDMKIDPRKALLDELGKGKKALNVATPDISVRAESTEKFATMVETSLLYRSGLADNDEGAETLRRASLVDLAKESMELHGVNTRGMYGRELIGEALNVRGVAINSTSTFPKILENIANKGVLRGHSLAEETFEKYTTKGSLSDKKITKRVGLGHFNSLNEIREGAEYQHITVGEGGEAMQLATYGGMFSISRDAILNDDLAVFTTIPQRMGMAAKSTVGDLVANILLNNTVMSDNLALFHADHNNIAGTAAVPTVASLGAARVLMAKQKSFGGKGRQLGIKPKYAICPPQLFDTFLKVVGSETDISSSNSKAMNPIRNMVEVISETRLSDSLFTNYSTTAWYLIGNQMVNDTIEVAYLNGIETPYLESKDGWNVDGIQFKVRLDAAATALDYRSFVKNAGA